MKRSVPYISMSVYACVVLSFFVGCGKSDKKSKITGVITYKSDAVKGGNIYLTSAAGSYSSPIQMDGNYVITDVPPGTYAVTIETESVNPDRKSGTDGKKMPGGGAGTNAKAEKLNREYAEKMGKSSSSGSDGGAAAATSAFGAAPREELLKRYTKIPSKYGFKETSGLQVEVDLGTIKKDFVLTD